MNRTGQFTDLITVLLVGAVLTSGCATNKLWEKQSHHPAGLPNLALSLDVESRDLLVQYDEQIEDARKLRRQAFWLFASTNALESGGVPKFVKVKDYSNLMPIPIYDAAPASNALASGFVAVATPWQQGFDLWQDGVPQGRFYLPIYFESPRVSVWRVVATPFAALGDTVVAVVAAAAAVSVVVGLAYLQTSGGNIR